MELFDILIFIAFSFFILKKLVIIIQRIASDKNFELKNSFFGGWKNIDYNNVGYSKLNRILKHRKLLKVKGPSINFSLVKVKFIEFEILMKLMNKLE